MYGGQIHEIFAFHPATALTGPLHDSIRGKFREFAGDLDNILPESPEATTAIRKLQEAMMFANAAVAIHSPKGEPRNPFSGTTDPSVPDSDKTS